VITAMTAMPVCSQQASADSSSAIVSPKSAGGTDASIEPRKPSVSEDTDENSVTVDPATLLPDLPPLPHRNATLVGGTVEHLDRIRDRIVLRVFGGGKETVLFDPRTEVFRGGKLVTAADLHQGERIYIDTILDGSTVFARSMRLSGARAGGESQGVVVKCRSDRGEMTLRDAISPQLIQIKINSGTHVMQGNRAAEVGSLVPGSLVSVRFSSDGSGRNTANEISILALPGTTYTFIGEVVHIDLRSGLLVLNSSTDHKTYEVYLASSAVPDDNLHPGATVTAVTDFDGSRYLVRNLTISRH